MTAKAVTDLSKFLRTVYPFLKESEYHKECIEIRPVRRDRKSTGEFVKSLNLWRLDEDGVQRLEAFVHNTDLKKHCMYYPTYVFDYSLACYHEDGTPYIKGCCNSQNALYTRFLPMDFDNISESDFRHHISRLEALGIFTVQVFTGHGYQALILLDDPCYEKKLLKNFTELLISKGYPVDPSIIDPARVLRLPGTYNCKNLKKGESPIHTKLLQLTEHRYSLEQVFRLLGAEKNGDSEPAQLSLFSENEAPEAIKMIEVSGKGKKGNQDVSWVENKYNEIQSLDFPKLPGAIKEMLLKTPKNFRNEAMMFLVGFFRHSLGLSKSDTIEVLNIWKYNCAPIYEEDIESEVNRFWHKDYFKPYSSKLAEQFGPIKLERYKQGDTEVILDNMFFRKFADIHETAVMIYVKMKIEQRIANKDYFTYSEIVEVSGVTKRTCQKYFNQLIDARLVYKHNKKYVLAEGKSYFVYQISGRKSSYGYTKIDVTRLSYLYDKRRPERTLSTVEAKLALYIIFMVNGSKEKDCWASQAYLGKCIGKSRTRVCELTTNLTEKFVIRKDSFIENMVEHCVYELTI